MKIALLISLIFFSYGVFAQTRTYTSTYCNGVKAWSNNIGGLIELNEYGGNGGLVVNPQDDNEKPVSSIFNLSAIMAGYSDGELKGLFRTDYPDSPISPFFKYSSIPGPNETGSQYFQQYNKIWNVNMWEIKSLIQDFNDNQKIDHPIPASILSWPGRGNPYSKEIDNIIWPDRAFAPFFDRDKNGSYDPYKGDHPALDQSCPNKIPGQMSWSLYHASHSAIEMQTLIYAFSSDINPILNNTVFSKITVINFNNILRDTKFGIYYDFDLGCIMDDYIGTSVEKNSVYVYNKTEKDLNPCSNQSVNYNPFKVLSPMQSVTCLNKPMSGTIMYGGDNSNAAYSDPSSPLHFYKYISTKWLNNLDLTYGGIGYDVNSTNKTNFIFPSSPSDPSGWSMPTADFNPIDPRGFMNFDLGKLNKNQTEVLDFAYTYHLADLTTDHFSRVDAMLENIDKVKVLYTDCFDSEDHIEICVDDCVWPGDTDNNGIVNNLDLLSIGPALKKEGPKREIFAEYWRPFFANQWSEKTPQSVNFKHIDCNGSGLINKDDVNPVKNNFYSTNYKYEIWGGYNIVGDELTFSDIQDSLKGGEEFKVFMKFGENSLISLFGMAFTVEYDTTFLEFIGSVFEKKWLDKKIEPYSVNFNEKGNLHFGIVKYLGANVEVNNANIGSLSFKVKSNFEGNYTTLLKYKNYEKVTDDGRISQLTSSSKSLVVSNPITTVIEDFKGLILYPNPTIEFVFIKSDRNFVKAELYDCLGLKTEFLLENNSFRVTNNPTGAYMVKLTDDKGVSSFERLVIVK